MNLQNRTRSLRVLLPLSLLSFVAPTAAQAADACEDSYVAGQKQAKAHKLLEAKQTLKECLKSDCPSSVRDDCSQTLSEVNGRLPTVVFAATVDGTTTTNVTVAVGDHVLASKLDGIPVELNPGAYTFVFTTADGRTAKVDQAIYESKKDQEVRVAIAAPASNSPSAGSASTAGTATAPHENEAPKSSGTTQRVVGFTLAGVGLVAAGVGLFAWYLPAKSDLDLACDTVTCKSEEDRHTFDQAGAKRNLGIATMVGGGIAIAAGVTLVLIAPSSPTALGAHRGRTLAVGVSGRALTLTGSF